MLTVNNLEISFSGYSIFSNVSFSLKKNDKIGLIGRNGVGKTTIFRIISDKEKNYNGYISKIKDIRTGYLPQEINLKYNTTVVEETKRAFEKQIKNLEKTRVLEQKLSKTKEQQEVEKISQKLYELNTNLNLEEINYDSEVEKILLYLGFPKKWFKKKMKDLSGGWQMRVELAKVLLQKPDILLLDEPTNHLDINSILWLESYLKSYRGAVLVISHDKTFLDNVTNKTVEITSSKSYEMNVPYSKFIKLRQERVKQEKNVLKGQEKFIKEQEKFINRFKYKSTKAKQVQSRIKQLEKFEKIKIEEIDYSSIKFNFPESQNSGQIVFKADKISFSYDNKETIIDNVSFEIDKGQKICFVGQNGQGKTTMAKIIANILTPKGPFKTGFRTNIGYYAQIQEDTFNNKLTVYETIFSIETETTLDETYLKNILGAFLFKEQDFNKKVKVLSGGEKSRLALACLLLKPTNVLILDEPTNHLDISSKEILKKALLRYKGTIIVVSHDRDFLSGLTTRTFEFKNKKISKHEGDIKVFLEKLGEGKSFRDYEINNNIIIKENKNKKNDANSLNKKFKKKKSLNGKIKKCENKIKELEIKKVEYMGLISKIDYNLERKKFEKFSEEIKEIEKNISLKNKEWESLFYEIEKIQ